MHISVAGAAKALLAFYDAMHSKTVSVEEIQRRSSICAVCPKRRSGSGVAEALSKKLGQIANRRQVPQEVADYHCGVCGCSLMLLLPATEKDLHKDSAEESANRPAGCWINQTN